MRTKMFVGSAVVAFVIGAGIVGVAAASDNDDGGGGPVSQGKQDALDNAVRLDPDDLGPEVVTDPVLRAAFPDKGDPADIRAIKDVVDDLLSGEQALGNIPQSALSDPEHPDAKIVLGDEQVQSRREAIEQVDSAKRVDVVLWAVEASLEQNMTDPAFLFTSYQESAFELSKFEGVSVEGDKATVLFQGHNTYQYLDGKWGGEPESQYLVTLVKAPESPHGWLIDELTSRFVFEPGADDNSATGSTEVSE